MKTFLNKKSVNCTKKTKQKKYRTSTSIYHVSRNSTELNNDDKKVVFINIPNYEYNKRLSIFILKTFSKIKILIDIYKTIHV